MRPNDISIKVGVDTSRLDEALRKFREHRRLKKRRSLAVVAFDALIFAFVVAVLLAFISGWLFAMWQQAHWFLVR